MAAPATADPSADTPPLYDEVVDICQPTILILAGQSIHAETADSAPLYQLNRGIASLTHATQTVELQRVQYSVKTTPGGAPAVRPRDRHIYNLRHKHKVPGGLDSWPSESPNFYIESVSSSTKEAGTLGLKRSRFPGRKQWRVLRVDRSGRNSKNDFGLPTFFKGVRPVFEISHNKAAGYEWTDGEGRAVAIEDEGEDTHRLIVTASLPRQSLDALVALWCCRIWQFSADNAESIYPTMQNTTIVRSIWPVMQDDVLWHQVILSWDSQDNHLSGTEELSSMSLGAHSSSLAVSSVGNVT
ncbi:hypothetical protein DHEL01_v203932 [Diaporthe helianthi]|uniref:Uncharacterized protein n=1 Tax=Diaporthe helianthi TaxID=158607 RepID=A0A2P5I5B1_DIAHE|nr:hypothetical protein DHEL01_v203932 [Diaporthe helianthi]